MLTVGFKKCCKYRTYSTFGVFRFLLSRGTIVHLPSQENEIQNLFQQPAACRSYFFDTLYFCPAMVDNPRFYRGKEKALVKIITASLMQAEGIGEKITSKYNRNGLAAALLKYRRLKT